MLTDGRTDGRTHGRTDDGRKVITIAHPEQSSGELKKDQKRTYLMMIMRFFFPIFFIKAYAVSTHLNCIDKLIGVCAVIRSNMVHCLNIWA